MAKATAVVTITERRGRSEDSEIPVTAWTSSTRRAAGPPGALVRVIHGAAGEVRLNFASFIHAGADGRLEQPGSKGKAARRRCGSCRSRWAGFRMKFHSPGTTTLGTRSAALAPISTHASPMAWVAAGGGLSFQFFGSRAGGTTVTSASSNSTGTAAYAGRMSAGRWTRTSTRARERLPEV